tara:strand:- start:154 stop:1401 length:1248 start_codon:yes stop_codon:yes gene_type:complete
MTQWSPDWRVIVQGVTYTNLTLANLTITSGRIDIYQQPVAGYCSVSILNFNQTAITFQINDSVTIELKDSAGVYKPIFGGTITDLAVTINSIGSVDYNQRIDLTALGALSRLPKSITEGALVKAFDGDQMYALLSTLLFGNWNSVPAATTWATYDATETWENAVNTGLGEIDQPGDYELDARDAASSDYYSIAALIANSGLGYLYEDAQGRIGYADSTHRSQYFSTNGYVDLSANDALGAGFKTVTRSGDIRNKVTILYKKNQNSSYTDSDLASIASYGELAQVVTTTLDAAADAQTQAEFYLALRAYPQAIFDSITYQLANPELADDDRDSLINVFMGLPLNIADLPPNISEGSFQGFVEGWTFRAGYNTLELTFTLSPLAYSLQAFRWNSVPITESWNTINPTLDWLNATIVA